MVKAYNELKSSYIKLASAEVRIATNHRVEALVPKFNFVQAQNTSNNTLERVRQSLEYLALKHRDKLDSSNSKYDLE